MKLRKAHKDWEVKLSQAMIPFYCEREEFIKQMIVDKEGGQGLAEEIDFL